MKDSERTLAYNPSTIINTNVDRLMAALDTDLKFTAEGMDLMHKAANSRVSYMQAGWALIHFSSRMKKEGLDPCITENLKDETGSIPESKIFELGASLQDFFNLRIAEKVVDSYTVSSK